MRDSSDDIESLARGPTAPQRELLLRWRALAALAGGIAHDMNNALQTIVGAVSTVEKLIELDHLDRAPRFLEAAMRSSQRGGELTRALQRLARYKPEGAKSVEINSLLVSMEELFRRLCGAGITLHIRPADAPATVVCDPGELESLLLNLVIDAVEEAAVTGAITLATQVGESVCISISELSREPVFLQDFATRHGGRVAVEGRMMCIYLPSLST